MHTPNVVRTCITLLVVSVLLLALGAYLQWLEARDRTLATAVDAYTTCVENTYRKHPVDFLAAGEPLPACE